MELRTVTKLYFEQVCAGLAVAFVIAMLPYLQDAYALSIDPIGGGGIIKDPVVNPCFNCDFTPPIVTVPTSPVVAEATSAAGARVEFSASANDDRDGAVKVTCVPASGTTFPLGSTTVTCTATDSSGNQGTGSFNVIVRDTTKPEIVFLSSHKFEATSAAGARVTYKAVAKDLVDGESKPTCTPASGSTFPLGSTTVTCTATDKAGNPGTGSFEMNIQDTTKPEISIPGSHEFEATSAAGATVTYEATAEDKVDGELEASCTPSSGSNFDIGRTTVTCTATDEHGNEATESFTMTVEDTEAPSVSVPTEAIQMKATGQSGAIVNYDDVGAEDLIDGEITADCEPESGSTFPIGDNTVKCTATDEAGNEATKSFSVVVSPADNNLPIAIITPPSEQLEVGKPLTFSADKSSDEGGSIVDYSWDFGDGSKGNGISVSHSYRTDGVYTVTLEVTDNRNGKVKDTEELTLGALASTTPETPTTPQQPEVASVGQVATPKEPQAATGLPGDMLIPAVGAVAAAGAVAGIVIKMKRKNNTDKNIP